MSMNAYEIPNLRFSLPAGGTVARNRFVTVNTDGKGVAASAAGKAIGVSMNQVIDGQVLEVADGIVIVEASALIAAGANIGSAADGKAVTSTGTDVLIGIAITAASAAGEFIAVKII